MRLIEYIEDRGRRACLVAETGVNQQYLWQIATGWRGKRASQILALSIERATDGAVTRHDLRPDIYGPAPTNQEAA